MKRQSTPHATPDTISHKWWLVDAKNQVVGRVASQVAALVKGKHHVDMSPGMDVGDYVVIINAKDVRMTGKKEQTKKYYTHSGYPGGLKTKSYSEVMQNHPERILEHAIKGMLPRHKIKYMSKVKIFAGSEHDHAAQSPVVFVLQAGNKE